MGKCVILGHMWSAKAQINLHIRPIWSLPFAARMRNLFKEHKSECPKRLDKWVRCSESALCAHAQIPYFSWRGSIKTIKNYLKYQSDCTDIYSLISMLVVSTFNCCLLMSTVHLDRMLRGGLITVAHLPLFSPSNIFYLGLEFKFACIIVIALPSWPSWKK